ncbi:FAD-dependent oxidoreductase [Paludibacterium denitrificans]|uniref:FAD-dependent oxidoreductase n=1 Tax=Paludibacterium denitrificans TaxID=2675226 RepID=UPI0028A9CEA0|nr:FAD-dependent oxidoreductase [Paludibacterium denitrificans]
MLAQMAPKLWQALGTPSLSGLSGRAAFRSTSPDYLPIIGPVVRQQDFIDSYLPLSKDATLKLDTAAPRVEGLYVNTAHGSRGMITAPLSGEILAAYLDNEPAPLPVSLMQAIHPNRFTLRDLIRQKLPGV